MQLTPNAIPMLHSSPFLQHVNLTLQASNIKLKQENVMCFDVTDGSNTAKAFVDLLQHANIDFTKTHRPASNEPKKYVITVTKHTYHQYHGRKIVQILGIDPQESKRGRQQFEEIKINEQLKRQANLSQKVQSNKEVVRSNGHNFVNSQSNNGMIQIELSEEEQLQEITEENMKQFEKISDLYIDFQNWQILVRVLDSSYKEFNSKQGKLTKLLNMMLIDKTGLKIQTSLFGQDALALCKRIKKGSVYKISNGLIKQHLFNKNLPEDQSKLTILFSKQSKIVEVRDIPSIPRDIQLIVTIEKALSQMNFQKSYMVMAVLLQVGEQMETSKENGKKIYRKNILVGDPETMKSIECLIWNKNILVDEKNLFKTVCLKNFKLNNYRDKLSFTSTFKSEVQHRPYPKWNQFLKSIRDFPFVSVNSQKTSNSNSNDLKISEQRTISQLENEIQCAKETESITSELQVWITFIKFQGKWFYGACNNPKCKKAAESHSKCQSCGIYNEEVTKKYMLPVELTDFSGSLWLTAFDDFGNEIMKGYKLQELEKLPEARLKEVAQKMLYQQFRVKVTSKKEGEGLFRHMICGKPNIVNIQKAMLRNLGIIKRAIQIQ